MSGADGGPVSVRAMERGDVPAVHRMIHELAAFEGVPDGPRLSEQGERRRQEPPAAATAPALPNVTVSSPPSGDSTEPLTDRVGRDLIEDGFSSSPSWFFGLVAERAGGVVGYALCNRAYSSWTRRAFYVEDLYVAPAQRACGVGASLMQRLCQMALAADVHRIDWHVLASNAGALRFYERLGARDLATSEGRAALRLDRPRIEAVAQGLSD